MNEPLAWAVVVVVTALALIPVGMLVVAVVRRPGSLLHSPPTETAAFTLLVVLVVPLALNGSSMMSTWRSLQASAVADAATSGSVVEERCRQRATPNTEAVEFSVEGRSYRAWRSGCTGLGKQEPVIYSAADPSIATGDVTPSLIEAAASNLAMPLAVVVAVTLGWGVWTPWRKILRWRSSAGTGR